MIIACFEPYPIGYIGKRIMIKGSSKKQPFQILREVTREEYLDFVVSDLPIRTRQEEERVLRIWQTKHSSQRIYFYEVSID